MRRFTDGGRTWDVVLGRESWGRTVAIFVPVGAGEEVREAPLAAAGYEEAGRELDALDEDALRALLERSRPKEIG